MAAGRSEPFILNGEVCERPSVRGFDSGDLNLIQCLDRLIPRFDFVLFCF